MMPVVCVAQTVDSFEHLSRVLRRGDDVTVTLGRDAACNSYWAVPVQGRITDLSPATLTVTRTSPWWRPQFSPGSAGAVAELGREQVCIVQRRHQDSPLNGAVIGAIINFSFAMSVRTSPGQESEISNRGLLIFTGLGALAGIGVDLLFRRGRETVYRALNDRSASGVQVVPVVAGGGLGLEMTLRF